MITIKGGGGGGGGGDGTMHLLLYNPSEIIKACTVKTEACCAHTNSVHNTLQFLQCDICRTY